MPIIENFSEDEIRKLENNKGRIIYNTTNNIIQYNNGTEYININNIQTKQEEVQNNIKIKNKNEEWVINCENDYLDVSNNLLNKLVITKNGNLGLNCINPNKQLSINSINGECLRLIYNNRMGIEKTYLDINIEENGKIIFNSNGLSPGYIFNNGGIEATIITPEQTNITLLGILQKLELQGPIIGVTKLCTKEIEGIILTNNQPNITRVGDLEELTIIGKLNLKELSTIITNPKQINITELGELNYLNILGKTKINTSSIKSQLTINNPQGNCLRLIYNNSNGTESIYSDFNIDCLGNLNINPTGTFIKSEKCLQINNNKIGFSHKSINGTEFVTIINDTKSVSIGSYTNDKLHLITNNINRVTIDTIGNFGINTKKPNKCLTVNNINSGGCIRLIYDNSDGLENVFTDYEITSDGTVIFDINSNSTKGYIFKGGNVSATINTPIQPYITSIGTLTELNMSGPINNATTINAEYIQGKLLSHNQPNIKSIGELDKLKINSELPLLYNSILSPQLALFKNTVKKTAAYIEIENECGTKMKLGIDGSGYNSDEINSVILSCWTNGDLRFLTNAVDRMRIKSNGMVGINTKNPQRQLSINSNTGECLRLSYNDNAYLDCLIKSNGTIIFEATGTNPKFQFNGGELLAILSKAEQPNITSVGVLSKLELSGPLTGVTTLTANTLSGLIVTPIQPNIVSIGILSKLELNGLISSTLSSKDGKVAVFTNTSSDNGSYIEINNNKNNKAIFGLDSSNFNNGNVNDVIIGNYSNGNLKLITNSNEYLRISQNGFIGINTIKSNKQLNINSKTGDCIRLIYNNNNGTEDKFLDINVLSNGDSEILSSGKSIYIKNNIAVGNKDNDKNIIEFNNRNIKYNNTYLLEQTYNNLNNNELLIYKEGNKNRIRFESYEYIFQTINENDSNNNKLIIDNNGNISINTTNNIKQLNINSKTGDCIRLIYNNDEKTYLDINIDKNGLVSFEANGNKPGFNFNGGTINAVVSNPNQPNIKSLGILDNLDISGKLTVNELSINKLDTIINTEHQPNIKSIGDLKYLNIDGKLTINTDLNEMQININEENGNCMRLLNNNSNYVDFIIQEDGNLNIKPKGEYISTNKQFEIIKNGLGYSHKSDTGVEFITSVSNINGVSIGSYSNNNVHIITNNMSRMTITSNGNIGIGIQTPQALLDFGNNPSNSLLYLYNNNNNIYGFGILNNTLLYQSGNNSNHAWYTNSNKNNSGKELMKLIGETGYLGIGISKPLYPLHINGFESGIAHSLNDITINTIVDTINNTAGLYTSSNHSLILGSNNKKQIILSNNGNIGIGVDIPVSTLHLKNSNKNIITIENTLDTSTANIQYKTDKMIWEMGAKGSNNTSGDSFYIYGNNNDRFIILPNGNIGINTISPKKQLTINSNTGECLRLSNNSAYLDCIVSQNGEIIFNANGESPKFKFVGEMDCIISNAIQPNITSIGILSKLDISGNLNVTNNIQCSNMTGIITTEEQPNIKSLGELKTLKVSNIINNFNKGGLIVRSYNSNNVSGRLIKEEIISSINLNNYNPNNINNYWSIEILGYINPKYTELYKFYILTKNKIRCWINNKLVYNSWKDNSIEIPSINMELDMDNWYPIYIQYAKDKSDDVFLIKWESLSQPLEIIDETSIAWDNHIDNYNLRYPLITNNSIEIYNSDSANNINGNISIDIEGNMLLGCSNNTIKINGDLSAKLITPDQPNIKSVGILNNLKVIGDITNVNKLEAKILSGILETKDQPNITSIGTLTSLNVVGNITNVNKLEANTLSGIIVSPTQPNITSIGTLNNLNINGEILGATLISSDKISGTIITNNQPNITSIGTLNILNVNGIIKANNFEINSTDTNCLNLYYNKDKYNSEIYTKFNINKNGDFTINSSGNYINLNNTIQINNNGYGFTHMSEKGIKLYTYINDNIDSYFGNQTNHTLHITTNKVPRLSIDKDGYIGINTTSIESQLVINNVTGNCLRLMYNNDETLYSNINIDMNGNLSINSTGNTIYTSSQLRIQSNIGQGLSILSPNGLNEYVTNILSNDIQIGTPTNTSFGIITNNKNRLNIDTFGVVSINNKLNIVSDNNFIQNKENIDETFCKEFINIEPKKYNKINSDNSIHYGYIAQDLMNKGYESLTNIINNNDEIIHTVSTTDIIPLLAKNIKMLYNENKELKERLERLEKIIINQ